MDIDDGAAGIVRGIMDSEEIAIEKGEYIDFTGYVLWGQSEGWVKNASFNLDNHFFGDIVYWWNGTWVDGFMLNCDWQDGVWMNGMFNYGDWHNGEWMNGTFNKGEWWNGVWRNGLFNQGEWDDGTWIDGTFDYGKWHKGTWKGGTWKNGLLWRHVGTIWVVSEKPPVNAKGHSKRKREYEIGGC